MRGGLLLDENRQSGDLRNVFLRNARALCLGEVLFETCDAARAEGRTHGNQRLDAVGSFSLVLVAISSPIRMLTSIRPYAC